MKGVILAGGLGTRLAPRTQVTTSHLIHGSRGAMIWRPVRQFVMAGIREIMIVIWTDHMGEIVNSLGSSVHVVSDFSYRVQEKVGVIDHALALEKSFPTANS